MGLLPTAVVVPVGAGSSTLEVMVQGHSVMVSVVDEDTVYVWWLTVMTVGVGQTVMRVDTTVVVVVIWQSWYFLQVGGGCCEVDMDVVLELGGGLLDPLEVADDDVVW
jgi:hypothetical protein